MLRLTFVPAWLGFGPRFKHFDYVLGLTTASMSSEDSENQSIDLNKSF
jgi:hypothetical protein